MPTLPTLPQANVDTTYSLPTGTTHVCTTAAQFNTALTNAALNDIIQLQAGTTFTGPFTLPNKASGSGWIYIVSSALASLPAPGTRVVAADATNMPILEVPAAGTGSATCISCANGAHHFRFVGIEMRPDTGTPTAGNPAVYTMVELGDVNVSQANLIHHVIIDRCYIHGRDGQNGPRDGVWLNGANNAVIESHIDNCKRNQSDGQEAHAIVGNNGTGPFKIYNNYLEGSSENVMFGGAGPTTLDMESADITIQRNHLFKRLSWVSNAQFVKNLFEIKHAKRVLFEGNICENNWNGGTGQSGFAIVLTVRNDGFGAPAQGNLCEDITIRLNKIINVEAGFNMHGTDDLDISKGENRILIENNLVVQDDVSGNGSWRTFQLINDSGGAGGTFGIDDLTIRHNTFIAKNGGNSICCLFRRDSTVRANFLAQDNIGDYQSNAIFNGDGLGSGTVAFALNWSPYVWSNNVMLGSCTNEPAGNFNPANAAAINFVDYAGGNYRLTAGTLYAAGGANDATDGLDQGADINAIEAAIAGSGSSSVLLTLRPSIMM